MSEVGLIQVTIPEGITRIAPMILDANLNRRSGNKDGDVVEEFPLYQYAHIDTLVIPSSIEIPHDERYSSFASYEQRGFVWNYPTKWQKVHIAKIVNHSPHLVVEDGVLYSADKSRLIYCFEQKPSFIVPRSVIFIEPYAFCMQEKLKEIIMHDGITFIGDAAFMACSSLKEIVVPKQIRQISCDCFDGCTALRKVVLPDGLKGIGDCAFRQCKALEEIQLPDTVTSVCGFEGCSALREIMIPAGVEQVRNFMFCGSLRKVVLHEGVKRIDDYTFRFCDSLKDINFPEGLEYIGTRAFYPASLAKLVFPASLREIGCEAFYHNSKLHYVEFKSDVAIEQAAFACCPLLLKWFINKPQNMKIRDDVFIQDSGLDKYGFWD